MLRQSILTRYAERRIRYVDSIHPGKREYACKRHGYTSRAGTEIHYAQIASVAPTVYNHIDELRGLRPRYKHIGRNLQFSAIPLRMSIYILYRLPGEQTCRNSVDTRQSLRHNLFITPQHNVDRREPQRLLKYNFRHSASLSVAVARGKSMTECISKRSYRGLIL